MHNPTPTFLWGRIWGDMTLFNQIPSFHTNYTISLLLFIFFYSLQNKNIPSEFTQESVAVKWYSSVRIKSLTFIAWATVIHKAIDQPLNIIKLRVQMSMNAKSRTHTALSTNACMCVYTYKQASVKRTNTHTINRFGAKLKTQVTVIFRNPTAVILSRVGLACTPPTKRPRTEDIEAGSKWIEI